MPPIGFAEALAEAFQEQIATKTDLALLEQRLTIKIERGGREGRMAAMRRTIILALAVAASPAEARSPACYQTSYVAGKLAVAALNCNLPDNESVRRSLALFGDAAGRACGGGKPSQWPGSGAGAKDFYAEVRRQGRDAICGRITRESLEMSK